MTTVWRASRIGRAATAATQVASSDVAYGLAEPMTAPIAAAVRRDVDDDDRDRQAAVDERPADHDVEVERAAVAHDRDRRRGSGTAGP